MEIPMTEPRKFEPIEVPDGLYENEIVEINEIEIPDNKTKELRKVMELGFEITTGPYVGKVIKGLASKYITEKSKLFSWIKAAIPDFKIEVGKNFDMTRLMGRKCRTFIKGKERTYGNKVVINSQVTEVLPVVPEEKVE